jgi:hypothetical protein
LSADSTQRSAGWYAGALVFWLLAAWLAIVGLSSLVRQIFGPSFRDAKTGVSCAPELHDLTSELLDHAGEWIKARPVEDPRDTLATYFSDFDRRLMHAKSSCNDHERAAFAELSRLRHGVDGLLEHYAREQLPQVRKLHAFFGSTQAGQGNAPTP